MVIGQDESGAGWKRGSRSPTTAWGILSRPLEDLLDALEEELDS